MQKHIYRIVNAAQRIDIWPIAVRRAALRLIGVNVAKSAVLLCGIDFVQGPVTLGERVFINRDVLIDAQGGVTIGAVAHIAPRVMILTGTHHFGAATQRAADAVAYPTVIGAGAWIGAGAIILPGVTVGEGTIVAAGSVVTRDTLANWLYAGNPAIPKRDLGSE